MDKDILKWEMQCSAVLNFESMACINLQRMEEVR